MGTCELCGKDSPTVRAKVEGTEMNACKACARYGKILPRLRPNRPTRKAKKPDYNAPSDNETREIIVSNYASLIRSTREKRKLKQDQLARMLAERESVVQHLETGKMEPTIKLAKKLEHYLKIKLIEEYKAEKVQMKKSSSVLTLADVVKIRKR